MDEGTTGRIWSRGHTSLSQSRSLAAHFQSLELSNSVTSTIGGEVRTVLPCIFGRGLVEEISSQLGEIRFDESIRFGDFNIASVFNMLGKGSSHTFRYRRRKQVRIDAGFATVEVDSLRSCVAQPDKYPTSSVAYHEGDDVSYHNRPEIGQSVEVKEVRIGLISS